MGLPKIDSPVYEIQLSSIDRTVKFRPFLVKEEKLLLMAMESGNEVEMINAMKAIVSNCIINDDIKIENIPIFDLQYIFLQLRAKSVGEIINVTLRHPNNKNSKGESCDGVSEIEIDVNQIKPTAPSDHSKKIVLGNNIGVMMKYPTMNFYDKIVELEKSNSDAITAIFEVILDGIDYIFQGDEIFYTNEYSKEELNDFINSLNNQQFTKIRNFFTTMPTISHKQSYICPKCKLQEEIVLQGVEDFFE